MSNKTQMALLERVNIDNLTLILKSWEILQYHKYSLWTNSEGDFKHKSLFVILNKYLNNIKKTPKAWIGLKHVDYEPAVKKSQVRGRIYPKESCGVITFPKYVRNFCLTGKNGKPLVIDIDIVNAHPVIYYQFLQKDEYPMDQLNIFKDYIDNRTKWIEKYGTQIKEQILCTLNCANILKDVSDEVELIIRELWKTQDWLMTKYELKDLKELKEFIYNKNCKIERDIIEIAFEYIRSLGIEPEIYAYDGFCIPYIDDPKKVTDIIQGLNHYVSTNSPWKVIFTTKPIVNDQRLLDILKNSKRLLALENCTKIKLDNGNFISSIFGQQNILEFDDIKEDVIVFKGPMGDGKTWYIYNCLKRLIDAGRKPTAISILNRISLVGNVCFDYDFVKSYLERPKDETKLYGIGHTTAICCESLHRFTPETLQSCDYLILDEFMSILTQFQSVGTHKGNLSTNQNIFWGLIRRVKKIIIMDANIERRTIDFIKFIRQGGSIRSYEITPRKNKEVIFTNEEQLILLLEQSARDGKKFVIPITRNMDDFGKEIQSRLEQVGSRVLFINQKTKDKYKEYIDDTSKWTEFDVVMFSPTISSGVSCVVKDYFDFVACFFSGQSCNAYESGQMIGRLRYPKENTIYINLNLSVPHPIYNKNPMNRNDLLKHLYLNQFEIFNKHKLELDKKFNFETFREEIVHNERMELFLHTTEFQLFQYKSYRMFLETALQNSYHCTFINETDNDLGELTEEEYKKFKLDVHNNKVINAENILTTITPTKYEAEILELEQKTSTDEYTKYQLVSKSKIPDFDGRFQYFKSRKIKASTFMNELKSHIIPNVKKLERIFTARMGLSKDSLFCPEGIVNPLQLETSIDSGDNKDVYIMENDIKFEPLFQDKLFDKDLSARHCITLWKGELVKVQYAEFILKKFFGSKFLWEKIQLTDDNFKKAQFELYKFVYDTKNKIQHGGDFKYTFKRRLEMLFDMNLCGKSPKNDDDYKTFFDTDPETGVPKHYPISLEKILSCCNLKFVSDGKRKRQRVGDKLITLPRDKILQMSVPVILDDRYPTDITFTKKYSQDFLPVVFKHQNRLILQNSDTNYIDMDLYKSSVFYKFEVNPSVKKDNDDE